MKRYLVFAYDAYYPSGGWSDFRGSYDTLEEAQIRVKTLSEFDYKEIVDRDAEKEVYWGKAEKEVYWGK